MVQYSKVTVKEKISVMNLPIISFSFCDFKKWFSYFHVQIFLCFAIFEPIHSVLQVAKLAR